tara:strand:+ start:219 stop:401 length:183 start_codon:yes stop_codon:yes gene_type:complete
MTLKKIDEVAIRWNKTRNPKDKELWYKLIKGWNGINNIDRRNVSSSSDNERNDRRNVIDK